MPLRYATLPGSGKRRRKLFLGTAAVSLWKISECDHWRRTDRTPASACCQALLASRRLIALTLTATSGFFDEAGAGQVARIPAKRCPAWLSACQPVASLGKSVKPCQKFRQGLVKGFPMYGRVPPTTMITVVRLARFLDVVAIWPAVRSAAARAGCGFQTESSNLPPRQPSSACPESVWGLSGV